MNPNTKPNFPKPGASKDKPGAITYVVFAAAILGITLYIKQLIKNPNTGDHSDLSAKIADRVNYDDGFSEARRSRELSFTENELAAAVRNGKSREWCRGYYDGVAKNRSDTDDAAFKAKHPRT